MDKYGSDMVMAFADDLLVALTEGGDVKGLIAIVEEWAETNKIQLNKKKGKSAFVRLVLKDSKKDNYEETISGVGRQKEYKYLGIKIRADMNTCDGLKSATESINWERNQYKINKMNLSMRERLAMWRTYLMGKANYHLVTMPFCSKSSQKKFRTRINIALKHSIGLAKCTNTERVYLAADMITPWEYAMKFVLRLIVKLTRLGMDRKEMKDIYGVIEDGILPLNGDETPGELE